MFIVTNVLLVLCNFIFGSPLESWNKYTLPELTMPATQTQSHAKTTIPSYTSSIDDITSSGDIRLLVWNGAIKAWENNPIFGTGVETYAFAYYRYKSPAHNLTSEWDYLYNKAHNEYLNYLATTGIFGLGTYLGFLCIFFFIVFTNLRNRNDDTSLEVQKLQADTVNLSQEKLWTINFGLLAGYISILISNFFGFSVVIINLYTVLVS